MARPVRQRQSDPSGDRCGKGRFAIGMAEQHPDVNFIAVEREEGALIMAAERCQQQPLPNLRFVSFDAAELREVFAPGEVDRIYLNFSDPWPKPAMQEDV